MNILMRKLDELKDYYTKELPYGIFYNLCDIIVDSIPSSEDLIEARPFILEILEKQRKKRFTDRTEEKSWLIILILIERFDIANDYLKSLEDNTYVRHLLPNVFHLLNSNQFNRWPAVRRLLSPEIISFQKEWGVFPEKIFIFHRDLHTLKDLYAVYCDLEVAIRFSEYLLKKDGWLFDGISMTHDCVHMLGEYGIFIPSTVIEMLEIPSLGVITSLPQNYDILDIGTAYRVMKHTSEQEVEDYINRILYSYTRASKTTQKRDKYIIADRLGVAFNISTISKEAKKAILKKRYKDIYFCVPSNVLYSILENCLNFKETLEMLYELERGA